MSTSPNITAAPAGGTFAPRMTLLLLAAIRVACHHGRRRRSGAPRLPRALARAFFNVFSKLLGVGFPTVVWSVSGHGGSVFRLQQWARRARGRHGDCAVRNDKIPGAIRVPCGEQLDVEMYILWL